MSIILGYTEPLYILPFDHRSSFLKMLNLEAEPTPQQVIEICQQKRVVYDGFVQAVSKAVPKAGTAILIDEQFGTEIAHDAVRAGYTVCLAAEKSGQDEFDFEYGDKFAEHIKAINPRVVKVLIRYNPEGDAELNARQRTRLKLLSDFCHQEKYKFLIESLIPPTPAQLQKIGEDSLRYDRELRPALMVRMVAELQAAEIEVDVWKIEGLDQAAQYARVLDQIHAGGRDQVGAIVLGRGANWSQVEHWITVAASVPGIIGFAVGRTVWWQPLVDLYSGKLARGQAVEAIGRNYQHFYRLFQKARPT